MSRQRTRSHHPRLRGYAPGEQLGTTFSLGGRVVRDRRVAIEWEREFKRRVHAAQQSGSPDVLAILVELDRQFFPNALAELDRVFSRTRGKENAS